MPVPGCWGSISWMGAGGSPAGGSIELPWRGVAEVELVLMS